ncbi:hypothetical protein A3Q56_07629 [Intoshia linei]|uniref:Uncharacterized protein n=1 Tax=Intoshia linei TaxID=1819745 RepID=A0A177ARI3_9BILA|nr:hypothetical protein A3Q56_07629 [Intoshia linei]
MPRKFSSPNCRTNYDEGCEKISAMPNVFSDVVTKNMCVPVNSPSIFDVPSSCLRQTDSKIDR